MNTDIHIGKLIRKKLEEDGRSIAWFAKKLSCDRTNVYKIFETAQINTGQLVRISLILKHNFCSYHYNYIERKLRCEFSSTEV